MARRRVIHDLTDAQLLEERPPFIPRAKNFRGSRKAGLLYQYACAAALKTHLGDRVLHEPWFQYQDRRGDGWCSPDIIILPKTASSPLILADCKLCVTPSCERKMRNIYKPVVSKMWPDEEIRMVQIAKNLRRDWDDIVTREFEELYEPKIQWDFITWNFRFPKGWKPN